MITSSSFFEKVACAVEKAITESEIRLPEDVEDSIRGAYARETNAAARGEYENIFANLKIAKEKRIPICQDTGLIVVYLTVPPSVSVSKELYDAVAEGVKRATVSVPLRPNAVDPMTRENTSDNCGEGMPAIHIVPGDKFSVTVLPKGAGSENMSKIRMMLPSQTDNIADFVLEVVKEAGSRPCPPIIVGVGVGGTFDTAASLAKEALLEPVNTMTEFEQSICNRINELGIGAMGLGGATTALAVKVKKGACHTASLPVAINIQCWCCRRYTEVIDD